jgi:uncharacterized membrane protein YdjX (TVP38/TMEM64 family)
MSEKTARMSDNEGLMSRSASRWAWRVLPVLGLLVLFAAGYLMGWHEQLSLERLGESRVALKQLVADNPVVAPLAYALLYAAAVAVAFPAAWVLTLIGGFLFGWLVSSILVTFAATAGASLLFLVARTAFGARLRSRFSGPVETLAAGFERNAFAYLLALRMAPVLPFFLVNIAPAVFSVRLRTYAAATFLGILPAVIAYSWLGQGLESALIAAEQSGESLSPADLVTMELTVGLGLMALVVAVGAIVKGLHAR